MIEVPEKLIYKYLLLATIFIISMGTIFYHLVEHFSWIDAYYFCVVTLATVGYGDLVPKTDVGKVFTTLYIFVGVGIITTFITYALRHRAETRIARRDNRKHKK